MSEDKDIGVDEFDVLDIVSEGNNPPADGVKKEENVPAVKDDKAPTMNLAEQLSVLFGSKDILDASASQNNGSGDVTTDLLCWINGQDTLPSNPLLAFLRNSALKSELAMFFMLLSNISRIDQLMKFVTQAEQVLYDSDANSILKMGTDELKDRHESADKIVGNLMEESRKIVYGLKKNKQEDELDRLKILLGALPTDKLMEMIKSLTK
jgi:hypothetical protein